MSEFDGLAAVVTGGASGIDLATVQLLAARGARVAVLDLDPSRSRPRRWLNGRRRSRRSARTLTSRCAPPRPGFRSHIRPSRAC
jgi:NAD(P)-dependent dehydrogenase (short-subunit alcohol dehydrogenase family)